MIKRIVHNLLGRLGYQIIRTDPTSKNKKYGPIPGYHRLDKLPPLSTVIDIGVGHQGSPFLYTRFTDADFISIDPLQEAEEAVQEKLGSNSSRFIRAAVGRTQQSIELKVSQTPSRTSLLERTKHDSHSRSTETRRAQILKAGNNTVELLFSQADDAIRETWAYANTEE